MRRVLGLFLVLFASRTASPQWADSPLAAGFRLDVNIPANRLDAWKGDTLLQSWPVAIGMPKWRTPTGAFAISSVEWNPWWIPPDSPWARDEKVTPPGPTNPMGRAKIAFGRLIFAHGTPFPESVGRAASHGCLRMRNENVLTLARLVLVMAGHDVTEVDRMIADTMTTRRVPVAPPFPVVIRYDLLEWRSDTLWRYPDVYRRGAPTLTRTLALLVSVGVDTADVSRGAVRSWLSRRITKAVPLVPSDWARRNAVRRK